MALHSRDAVTVSAAVATRSRADCSSMEGHTSLSTALVSSVSLKVCLFIIINWISAMVDRTLVMADYISFMIG